MIRLDQWQGNPLEWRVSWAALWMAMIGEKPTPQIRKSPNRAAIIAWGTMEARVPAAVFGRAMARVCISISPYAFNEGTGRGNSGARRGAAEAARRRPAKAGHAVLDPVEKRPSTTRSSPSGHPARIKRYRLAMAGLLARRSLPDADLPGHPVVTDSNRLAAYSCGGSHGLGPCWVVRTVFPINPLEFIRRGTIATRRYARGESRSTGISIARGLMPRGRAAAGWHRAATHL